MKTGIICLALCFGIIHVDVCSSRRIFTKYKKALMQQSKRTLPLIQGLQAPPNPFLRIPRTINPFAPDFTNPAISSTRLQIPNRFNPITPDLTMSRNPISLPVKAGDNIVAVVGGQDAIHKPMVVGGSDGIHIGNSPGAVIDTTRHVPWQAGIRLVGPGGTSSAHCGGTILTQDWILTAAHCFTSSKSVNDYIIRVGDLDNTVKEADEQEFKVSRIITHPSFRRTSLGGYDYDIALIAIRRVNNRGIQFGDNVRSAYIPASWTTVIPQTSCLISGWGRKSTVIGSGGTKVLQVATVNVLDRREQDQCNKQYRSSLTSRMFCAGYTDGTKIDSCAGDSGGPLVCKINGYDIVVGITSWGTNACAVEGYPGVYTNIQELLSWIYSL